MRHKDICSNIIMELHTCSLTQVPQVWTMAPEYFDEKNIQCFCASWHHTTHTGEGEKLNYFDGTHTVPASGMEVLEKWSANYWGAAKHKGGLFSIHPVARLQIMASEFWEQIIHVAVLTISCLYNGRWKSLKNCSLKQMEAKFGCWLTREKGVWVKRLQL